MPQQTELWRRWREVTPTAGNGQGGFRRRGCVPFERHRFALANLGSLHKAAASSVSGSFSRPFFQACHGSLRRPVTAGVSIRDFSLHLQRGGAVYKTQGVALQPSVTRSAHRLGRLTDIGPSARNAVFSFLVAQTAIASKWLSCFQSRKRITASLRASAVRAFFAPIRFISFKPQLLRLERLPTVVSRQFAAS